MAAEVERKEDIASVNKFAANFDRFGVPLCLNWTTEQVADWIAFLGLPQYKACFLENVITGRQLVKIHASTLPNIGITDFEHIKFLSKKIRELLALEEPDWNRSLTLQYRERLGMFLEKRSLTGCEGDLITYEEFNRQVDQIELHAPFKRVTYPSTIIKTNKQ